MRNVVKITIERVKVALTKLDFAIRKYFLIRATVSLEAVFFPLTILLLMSVAASGSALPNQPDTFRILMDQFPSTLNPRAATDANGQRINAMVLVALTHLNALLVPEPELAVSWEVSSIGKSKQIWKFKLREGLKDHEGLIITPENILKCLENYRTLKPISSLAIEFEHWVQTELKGSELWLTLRRRDPYLARNLSVLRYYRIKGNPEPCPEIKGNPELIGAGGYQIPSFRPYPDRNASIKLEPRKLEPGPKEVERQPNLELVFMSDDNSKGLKILRGEIDAAPSSISFAKQRWLIRDHSDRFKILTQNGTRVFYLGYNVKHPILGDKRVRQAISYAIDRELIVKTQCAGFAEATGTLLSPLLQESIKLSIPFDPGLSEKLLDQAGFKRGNDGVRFILKYKTTTSREGYDRAVILQDMLKKVGVKIILDVVEPTVFFAHLKKSNFELFSSSWIGVADASILDKNLRSGPKNRYLYGNPDVDKLLDEAMSELNEKRRIEKFQNIQKVVLVEAPFAPLFFTNNTIILKNEIEGLRADQISLTGALEPLTLLRRKN